MVVGVAIIVCITLLACTALVTIKGVKIYTYHTETTATQGLTQEDIQKMFEEHEEDRKDIPDFLEVVKELNKDWGGIDYGEQS